MALFNELDWDRIDVRAIAGSPGGLVTIDEPRHHACHKWLLDQGYKTDLVDFRLGVEQSLLRLEQILSWQERFGYSLNPNDINLDSLHSGFGLEIPEGEGRVLELWRPDLAWQVDPTFILGLLWIIHDYSRKQLALGRKFFALLIIPDESALSEAVITDVKLGCHFWSACREFHEFRTDIEA